MIKLYKMKTKTKKINPMSISQYADACGVTTTVIYSRIKSGEIKTFSDGKYMGQLIDLTKYPVVPKKKSGRKAYVCEGGDFAGLLADN